MEPVISSIEIWQLAIIKLLFYLFIGLGIIFYFRFKKPILFIILIALFLSATYLVIILYSQLPWWGLQGDEIFVTAFLERVASGQFFSDFFYGNLPPFYPPFYFWLVGLFAYLFKFNGVQAAQLGVTLVLFVAPFLVYWWQKLYWQKFPDKKFSDWQLVLNSTLVFIVSDWAAVILKPYEFISAVMISFWAIFLLTDLSLEKINLKKILIYGLSGGVLFLTYYFWFFPIIIAFFLFKLFTSAPAKNYFKNLILVGLVAFGVSLPYILPLLFSFLKFGAESWQPAYFIPADINIFTPFFEFSIFGLVALIGFLSIIFYWSKPFFKVLGVIFASAYIWQIISLLIITFLQASFLAAKPFLFLGSAVLAIAAGFGLSEFLTSKPQIKKYWPMIFVVGWILLASQLLGGTFLDRPEIRSQLVVTKQPLREEFVNLIVELKAVPDIGKMTILSSGVPQAAAYLPLNYYLSYNIHFSHPAANFSQRYYFISSLSNSIDARDFYQKLTAAPFSQIDALLLFKDQQAYPLFFWLDDYPTGGKEGRIDIPAYLIDEQYFDKVFEDDYFVFYQVKR